MKKLSTKLLSLTLALIMIVSLCACGSSTEASSTTQDAAEETKPETTKQEEVAASEESDEVIELVIWTHESSEQRMNAWNRVIELFEAENPNISIQNELVLWEDSQSKMLSAINSNTMPDMNLVSDTTWASAYLAGGLANVDGAIENIDTEYGYMDGCLSSFYADGHYWAAPVDSICYSLFYHPSMLEAAGWQEPPATWEELLQCAEDCTVDTDGDGNIDVYGICVTAGRDALATDTFGAFLSMSDTDLFAEDGAIAFDNEKTVKAMSFYKDLYQFAPSAASNWSWGEVESNWAAGTFAMAFYHAPNLAAFFENGNHDIATTVLPAENANAKSATTSFNHAIAVTTGAVENGHYDACTAFIEFCQKPEISWILTVCQEPGFYMPTTEAAAQLIEESYFDEESFPLKNFDGSDGSTDREILDNFLNVAMESLKSANAIGNKYGAVNLNLAEIYNSYVISDMMQKVLLAGEDVQTAVSWAQGRMEEINGQ